METVDVVYAHYLHAHSPGDRESLPVDDARRLVDSGYAVYANKTAAKTAGGDESQTKK
jgi:hypothetical protein